MNAARPPEERSPTTRFDGAAARGRRRPRRHRAVVDGPVDSETARLAIERREVLAACLDRCRR